LTKLATETIPGDDDDALDDGRDVTDGDVLDMEGIALMTDDGADEEREDGDEDEFDAAEVEEMFRDISGGKPYITGKQLRKWDELEACVDAGFASQEAVDSYFARLGIQLDTKVDMDMFGQFVHLLDQVMLDDLGNEIF